MRKNTGPGAGTIHRKKQERNSRTDPNKVLDEIPGRISPSWQLQTAKARFSELFRRARTEGPQRITRQGKEVVILISEEEYEHMTARFRQPESLVEFFRQSPLADIDLNLGRDQDLGRDIEL